MENLGAMAYSRYTGFREITDRDVLELHCIYIYIYIYISGFQVGPTIPTFPYFFFFVCSYFSLPFYENALLSLLFSPKILEVTKNSIFFFFPPSLCSLRVY